MGSAFWVQGSGLFEQRTAEYRISNRRISKEGIAALFNMPAQKKLQK
jgi:hypothetical protein